MATLKNALIFLNIIVSFLVLSWGVYNAEKNGLIVNMAILFYFAVSILLLPEYIKTNASAPAEDVVNFEEAGESNAKEI